MPSGPCDSACRTAPAADSPGWTCGAGQGERGGDAQSRSKAANRMMKGTPRHVQEARSTLRVPASSLCTCQTGGLRRRDSCGTGGCVNVKLSPTRWTRQQAAAGHAGGHPQGTSSATRLQAAARRRPPCLQCNALRRCTLRGRAAHSAGGGRAAALAGVPDRAGGGGRRRGRRRQQWQGLKTDRLAGRSSPGGLPAPACSAHHASSCGLGQASSAHPAPSPTRAVATPPPRLTRHQVHRAGSHVAPSLPAHCSISWRRLGAAWRGRVAASGQMPKRRPPGRSR